MPDSLCQVRDNRQNFPQIAKLIGRSRGAVTGHAYRLGLKSGQPPIPARALSPSNGERDSG